MELVMLALALGAVPALGLLISILLGRITMTSRLPVSLRIKLLERGIMEPQTKRKGD